ncbi:hypothetical protein [Methyloterricola oryzae]|uniref:hypothetical protein n=1 Tax=Methyloterricola oryzae TaxID=1495050 RepID=UPI0005EB21E1|nr:hypothetical protein [Methyloterricola oryzae]
MSIIEKIKNSRWSVVLLLAFVAGLYVLQNEAVTPFVESVVASDLFEENTSDLAGRDLTPVAVVQCNEFVRQSLGAEHPVEFSSNDVKTWELSGGRYLVRSQVSEQDESGSWVRKNFACNVEYTGGADSDLASWDLQGLEIRDI